jgi:hypothetical protein
MQIKRDNSIEAWLFDEIRNEWGKEREGIHLSDLLTPRQAYWKRKKPMSANNDEIMYWASGKAHERAFLRASGYEHAESKQWEGIWYSMDFFRSFPTEIKTRRKNLAFEGKEADEYEHYLNQLRGYCAIENKKQGWLWVWCLVQKQDDYTTKPELACYTVEFTDEELEREREKLIWLRDNLIQSLSNDDYKSIHLCPKWMCGKVKQEIIEKPYCHTCKKEFETQWGIEKHINSKTGKGHDVKKAVIKEAYEPRCKWFDDCKPFEKEIINGN